MICCLERELSSCNPSGKLVGLGITKEEGNL